MLPLQVKQEFRKKTCEQWTKHQTAILKYQPKLLTNLAAKMANFLDKKYFLDLFEDYKKYRFYIILPISQRISTRKKN